ncbi:hypothetical protein A3K69_07260 [Candidatus Bathyarchaeota archaeon RBG_16_57_9]|nr:MAG: hypothetical protein A3K69_07260 [Candidatus Bathyarchaeota archaeon RBG_16_57_9]OGD55898.1 MAG: hypothetical protein A3K81_00075 [Candidatus Bathyarchaeota archaeon RBG_13_60_20]
MALELSTDLILGVGALVVAATAIIMFMRATGGASKPQRKEPASAEPLKVEVDPGRRIQVPSLPAVTKRSQVEEARSKIRTLTLQQEILSMVMKRLFEAEDNSEITKDERERLSKNYDSEMSGVTEELKKAELIVSLNELEEIRTSIIEQFQETLTDTQTKIDLIIRELHIEQPRPEEPKAEEKPAPVRKPRRTRPRPAPGEEAEEEEAEEPEREEEEALSRTDAVEDRLERLKKNVLKELEELDKLELEAS